MENFTPISALLGGALIGVAAVILMVFNGRIAGISGIIGGGIGAAKGDRLWRAAFVLGLILAPVVYSIFSAKPIATQFSVSTTGLIAAGLIVGIGTQMGGGCTSGHGVCGNARLSARSLMATLTFMATGIATVYVMRHVVGG